MSRTSWSGFLRLSLVACPIYLSPATTRTKSIRLHQVWRAAREPELDPDRNEPATAASRPRRMGLGAIEGADHASTATRIALRPHDSTTGEAIEKSEIVKGYEYDRGQFVTFTAEEMKALDVESSKVVDLETFVPRGDIDPVYLDSPYYLYPDGGIAVEALRVITAAMTASDVAGIGRLTLSRRERMVIVEPHGPGMVLFTLRATDEVRAPQFGDNTGDLDAEMVAIARAIVKQRTGRFDPSTHRDRYQEALRTLIEAKLKGLPGKPREVTTPPPVIDLMAALKRSLAQDTPAISGMTATGKRARPAAERRQRSLLLPVAGGRTSGEEPVTKPATNAIRPRRKA
jgi:DNA end-binding protein Ku